VSDVWAFGRTSWVRCDFVAAVAVELFICICTEFTHGQPKVAFSVAAVAGHPHTHPQFRLIGHILLRLGPRCMTSRELNTPHACHHAVCDVDTAARSQASFVPFQFPRRRRALLMDLSTRAGSSTAGWDDKEVWPRPSGAWLFLLPDLLDRFFSVRPGFLVSWGALMPTRRSCWPQQAFSIRKCAVQLALLLDPK
jgi:hypothetical protein